MKFRNPIKEGIEDIKKWFYSHLDLLKVQGIRKSVEISSKITYNLLILLFVLIGLFFFGIALAFYIGSLLDSTAFGFVIVGGSSILLMLLMLIFSKSVFRFLLNFFARIFT